MSPHFGGVASHGPSPPPGGSAGVRRHQSLNYPTATAGVRHLTSGLKRAGTIQAPMKSQAKGVPYSGAQSPSPTNAEEEYDNDSTHADEDGSYFGLPQQQGQGQYPGSPIGRSSPWNTPGADWRAQVGGNGGNMGIDDVSRALSALEINQQYGGASGGFQQGQSVHPPRFKPAHPPPMQAPGMRGNNGSSSRKLQLVTDLDARDGQGSAQSASAYVPPLGHGLPAGSGQTRGRRRGGRGPCRS